MENTELLLSSQKKISFLGKLLVSLCAIQIIIVPGFTEVDTNKFNNLLWKVYFLYEHFLTENYHWWGLQYISPETVDARYFSAIAVTYSETDGFVNDWWMNREVVVKVIQLNHVLGEFPWSYIWMKIWASIHMPDYWSKNSCIYFNILSLTHTYMPVKLRG